MNRFEFLSALAAAGLPRLFDPEDPATLSQTQSLRVLLGRGRAQPIDGESFVYEGRRYRGSFSIASDGQIVNLVPLEQYLYSVVPREMPHTWPDAALGAQAIVARTYVLQRSSPARQYDLVPSEADQVYTGIDAEHPQSTAAVNATAGQALRFGNGFAQVMYSSCCGGHTESNADAWGGRPIQYLAGVPCSYCTDSPWYAWTKSVPVEQLLSNLEPVASIGPLQSIALEAPDSSGRPRSWTFQGANGSVAVKSEDVRRALGTRTLPSLLVRKVTLGSDASQPESGVLIEGAGLGHGVGLCQWGARGMALGGASARSILAFYYPGTGTGND